MNESTEIRIAKVTIDGNVQFSETITTADPTRQSGFPGMVKAGNRLILAWTDVGEQTKVQSAIVTFG